MPPLCSPIFLWLPHYYQWHLTSSYPVHNFATLIDDSPLKYEDLTGSPVPSLEFMHTAYTPGTRKYRYSLWYFLIRLLFTFATSPTPDATSALIDWSLNSRVNSLRTPPHDDALSIAYCMAISFAGKVLQPCWEYPTSTDFCIQWYEYLLYLSVYSKTLSAKLDTQL